MYRNAIVNVVTYSALMAISMAFWWGIRSVLLVLLR